MFCKRRRRALPSLRRLAEVKLETSNLRQTIAREACETKHAPAVRTIPMRRQALDHICATCKFQSQSRALLSRTSRRSVQISATPSTSEPSSSSSAGKQPTPYHTPLRLILADEVYTCRRPLRSPRHALLPPLRLNLRLAEPLHAQRHPRRLRWPSRACRLHPLPPRALSASSAGYTFHLPADSLHHSLHRSDSDQVAHDELGRRASGWEARLDGCAAQSPTGMDGPHALPLP